jgi:hypothetical protein
VGRGIAVTRQTGEAHHWVRGVAQQHHPPDPPLGQRLTIVQRLAQHAGGRRDDRVNRRMPVNVLCQSILGSSTQPV